MRVLLCAALLAWSCCADDADENVNTRHTIESVEIVPSSATKRLSGQARSEVDGLVGRKFDQSEVEKIAGRIAKELHRDVHHRIEKGSQPDLVKLFLEAPRRMEADTEITRLAYHSKLGFTGALQTSFHEAGFEFRAGILSDSDKLLERFAGYNLGISRKIGDRLRVGFDFESFHEQWNATTLRALEERPDVPGIYRERYHLMPTASIILADPLTLTIGIDAQQFQTQFPAARFEAANSVVTTLRYRRSWWFQDASRQEVNAGYSLRAATKILDSDYVYARHVLNARYRGTFGHQVVSADFLAGLISGNAPLFERFTLGDSKTLRGWSKFDIAPIGGTRVVHSSLEYTFHWLGFFYDTGAVWERDEGANVKQSTGVAVGGREGLFLALAFPLRGGSVQPVFILGMNF